MSPAKSFYKALNFFKQNSYNFDRHSVPGLYFGFFPSSTVLINFHNKAERFLKKCAFLNAAF